MDTKILAAAPVVEKIKKELIKKCEDLKERGIVPSMKVILVGDNLASLSYIKNKRKLCEEIGAHFSLDQLPKEVTQAEFLKHIDGVNNDKSINGIIIQLPVTDELKKLHIPNLVIPSKDIDGFHGLNTQNLYSGTINMSLLLPCTPKGIITLLNHYQIPIEGKHVVVVGRSLIVGKPMSMMLTNRDATVTLAHSKTEKLEDFTRNADIVVCAIGKARFLSEKHFNINRKTVVIDVGMNTLNGKLTGDVDFEAVKGKVSAITPVPGGVGPMTVVSLIENLITATELQLKG
jgi:methylenetetrahydrofolate dehydrogenase (NADP+)/methenyltetrahydrofolate cyclohydrolase